MRFAPPAAFLPVLLFLAGCVPAGQETQAASVATRFLGAVADKDGQAACGSLLDAARTALEADSEQPCAEAILDVDATVGAAAGVQVWGSAAQVRMGGDTLFLDHTHIGWRVRAAGCTPQGHHKPYDCEVAP